MQNTLIYLNPLKKTGSRLCVNPFKVIILTLIATLLLSCKKDASKDSIDILTIPRVEDVLHGNDGDLIDLLDKVRGSVGTRGPGSKTVWSRKNNYGIGLYVSANHVYNLSGWKSRNAEFFDPNLENMGIFENSQLPPVTGNIELGNTLIADFPLMHFDIAPEATNTTIMPFQDFYLGVIDNQRVQREPFPVHPDRFQNTQELQMYDPDGRTKAFKTWNDPIAGEKAIAVGYPQDKINYPNGAVAYGKILSDTEANITVRELAAAGDEEGDIAYRPDVEFLVDAQAIAGMSGGGVFNSDGQLLGIMVRASEKKDAPKIIRVVKISYIKNIMIEFYDTLSESNKAKLRPFIDGEL